MERNHQPSPSELENTISSLSKEIDKAYLELGKDIHILIEGRGQQINKLFDRLIQAKALLAHQKNNHQSKQRMEEFSHGQKARSKQ